MKKNYIAKFAPEGKRGQMLQVDLQGTRLGRPGLELAYFFCSSTSPMQRKNYFEDLLRFYYNQFCEELKSLGGPSEPCFSLDELKKEYDECYPYGFIMGCMHSQVGFVQ